MRTILDYDKPELIQNRQLADKGARFLNFVLDSIVALIVASASLVSMMVVFNIEKIEIFEIMLFFAGYFAYYIGMETYFSGKTIAKMLTKTSVVQTDGKPINFTQAFERTFIRLIPLDPFSIFFSDNKVCWHDTHSGTLVVQD
jgi:uncharacterized RDD family membrane protein YckC